ncbi:MAG: bifunctional UDP-N-acetylmuramoyl-tripeptide:D-alanyl-D-alanine ligase/alanine racemase [Dysgonamonadaceae bacterium]|jgi:alanine racemase|nr:bifunctional UDP-N-acetylmuramoyl-tripeptide:D-alanyl-D-alanine ligase/alanine racemase [Dysgonamonadaceae bacterium]
MKYSIRDIRNIIASSSPVCRDAEVSLLLTDSRSLSEGAVTLFFALKTRHNDGHKYIAELAARGVYNFVIQQYFPEFDRLKDCNFLLVPDTQAALQQLAAYHRAHFKIPIIGITGSNGKTVVKEWLYQLLNGKYNIVRSPRSYNSQIGVPLSVWQLENDTELGIFEAGISQPEEMNRLTNIIKPSIGILTNIGDAHQEYFSSVEQKTQEKLGLFKDCKSLIYNGDDVSLTSCITASGFPSERLYAWSKSDPQAFLFVSRIEKKGQETQLYYVFKGENACITIPFNDDASIENAIHCLATALYLQTLSAGEMQEKFRLLEAVAMRLDVKTGMNNCILINDTYNSDIHSLEIALDFMLTRRSLTGLKMTLILSDILQSGMQPSVLYGKIAALVEQKGVQRMIGIGKSLTEHAGLFALEKTFYPSTTDFLQSIDISTYFSSEIILLKGSRTFQFEKISAQLEAKVHETILEVNLDAIVYNFNYFRSKLYPSTKIVCMIKAFGYGIGSYELAKTLQSQRCDYLAVAVADEGAELRNQGISTPIIVMNPEMNSFNALFQHNLEPEIYNFRLLYAFVREAERRGITSYPVHIKLDTGMHRLGFSPEDADELILCLKAQKSIKVRSVFSHLVGSDEEDLDDYTVQQIDIFNAVAGKITQALSYPVLRHILNSAGIERFPQYQMDMVRLGIGLYGISIVPGQSLQSVATLRSTILQIRTSKTGETVGYNRKGVLQRDSRIACVPIGYADGLDRHLSNGVGAFSVQGVRCPILGNISMDVTLIDVTDTTAQEGDAVVIFGKEIPVTSIAEKLDTIPYEILTSISPRVKRVYFRE